MHVVDRRLNPKSKSLGNRQRFMRRAKAEIREAVREAVRNRKIAEVEGGAEVKIRAKSLREPSFALGSSSGERDIVLPGNHDFTVGDVIRKPESGKGGSGRKGSKDGEGQDDFVFSLTRDEFLDLFFEDLQLPNLVKAKLKSLRSPKLERAGFTTDGPPAKLSRIRTMRNSLARRIALRRPSLEALEKLEEELRAAEAEDPVDTKHVEELRERLSHLKHVRRTVAYIDPIDLKYNRFDRVPKPTTQAVMFCLMDVSASMTQDLKDLAKQFFMLLHLFLSRHYREVDIVFIRHTTQASEVDEDTFFRGTETGGTVVSTALAEMATIVKDRYPVDDWNIYAAQASDGHNFDDDMERCLTMLDQEIMPLCQYYAYIEVSSDQYGDMPESIVWTGYGQIDNAHPQFAMRQASSPDEIYPVFRELFARTSETA